MHAVVCPQFGAALELRELPPLSLAAHQVRIRVAAAGVNFADSLFIQGKYQEKVAPPLVPGMELAGTVEQVGADVTELAVGDRVMANVTGGGFASEAVADWTDVHKIPDAMDFVTAAAFPVAYGTSHLGLLKAALRPGEVLVVHGAAGGVGLTAVEIGVAMGATVIATAGGAEKVQIALDHGAHHGIDYKAEDVRAKVKELTGGRGADVVYDPVGGEIFDASLRSIAPDGRILVIGFASGNVPQIPANHLLVKNVTVIGYWWGAYRKLNPLLVRQSMNDALDMWAQGKLHPHVSQTLPLAQASEALALLKSRAVSGKLVLTI
ncbi:NADPH:quinone oxidoreductase family protein [Magnetospirillum gryphiswaldense]|uniref:Alcohol dehydrogenase superfamily, zinc-containing n=1 Tax=Magnetospirillum gryphiswaldense TaxID=55518 RepID=A4U345_9PROT|nr:NADPH:quinone oxidoreductase family protein [Magnetospirillum gryphiswaldense]AVM75821.1 Quinone oxidoreductase 1 [Magnetospirillum gryphiswaldense MSR-1]AVM79724.1 Quinone oxidoreductase 1 [Magnetospirillum gryphiswaldense]CAM77302.1 Alcohol dehydrogenase superfamily, zinc-containing [Magnetospirillum gryphiswaldense MSR-1]